MGRAAPLRRRRVREQKRVTPRGSAPPSPSLARTARRGPACRAPRATGTAIRSRSSERSRRVVATSLLVPGSRARHAVERAQLEGLEQRPDLGIADGTRPERRIRDRPSWPRGPDRARRSCRIAATSGPTRAISGMRYQPSGRRTSFLLQTDDTTTTPQQPIAMAQRELQRRWAASGYRDDGGFPDAERVEHVSVKRSACSSGCLPQREARPEISRPGDGDVAEPRSADGAREDQSLVVAAHGAVQREHRRAFAGDGALDGAAPRAHDRRAWARPPWRGRSSRRDARVGHGVLLVERRSDARPDSARRRVPSCTNATAAPAGTARPAARRILTAATVDDARLRARERARSKRVLLAGSAARQLLEVPDHVRLAPRAAAACASSASVPNRPACSAPSTCRRRTSLMSRFGVTPTPRTSAPATANMETQLAGESSWNAAPARCVPVTGQQEGQRKYRPQMPALET